MKKFLFLLTVMLVTTTLNAQLVYNAEGKLTFGNISISGNDNSCVTAWEGGGHYFHNKEASNGNTWLKMNLMEASPFISTNNGRLTLKLPVANTKWLEFDVAGDLPQFTTGRNGIIFGDVNANGKAWLKFDLSSKSPCISSASGAVYFFGIGPQTIYAGKTYSFSDRSDMTDIAPLENALNLVGQMRPKTYVGLRVYEGLIKPKNYGLLGDELSTIVPAAVSEDNTGKKYVDYGVIVPILTKAIQELTVKLYQQEKRIAQLELELGSKTKL